eukprot:s3293_g3.t1
MRPCQWPLGFEWKWRLLYCSLLLCLLGLSLVLLPYERFEVYKLSTWSGLCPGVLHVPGSSAGRHCSRICTVTLCSLIICLSTCLAGYPCVLWLWWEGEHPMNFGVGQQTVTLVLLTLTWICSVLRKHPRSTYAHDAKWCMFAYWLAAAAQQVSFIRLDNNEDLYFGATPWFQFGNAVQCVALGWTLYLLRVRISGIRSSLEQTSCWTTGSHIWIFVMCCSLYIRYAFATVDTLPLIVVSVSVLCTVWIAYTALTCKRLALKLNILLQETRRVRGPPRKQAVWAAQIIGMEILICTMLGLTMCCYGVVSAMWVHALHKYQTAKSEANVLLIMSRDKLVVLVNHIDWVVNSLGLGLLSGVLWQGRPPDDSPEFRYALSRGLSSMTSLLSPMEQEVYDQVVKQLAHRGFRLGALLNFWERLLDGQMMPGFDPRRSLTNDVVRRAIIPESRVGDGGRALATLWSSRETTAQVMVTHNWNNVFGNLLSAILADALGLSAHQEIAVKIATTSGFQQVRAKLTGKLETTYWVCAFSINQHASICAGFGPEPLQWTAEWAAWDRRRKDSVTGEAFLPCTCRVEKVFSNTDPRSELNKFDDMMAHLAREVLGFRQLIVLDDAFEVLFRAWCVAEIFEASVLGMESRIQVSSQDVVDRNYDRLSLLDVRQCTASSQADKEMIMAKIANVEVFNLKIQQLVFSEELGLFVQWVDGNERSRQVGRIVRRCAMSAESTADKPASTSRGCCKSLCVLATPSGDSDESSEEELTVEASDSFSSSS